MRDATKIYRAYIKELTAYRVWVDKTAAKYGGNRDPMGSWGNHDYDRVRMWSSTLKTLVRVLGLSAKEDKAADKEAGIEVLSQK